MTLWRELVHAGDDDAKLCRWAHVEHAPKLVECLSSDFVPADDDDQRLCLGAERNGVTAREHRRRIEDDEVCALPKPDEEIGEAVRGDEFTALGLCVSRDQYLELGRRGAAVPSRPVAVRRDWGDGELGERPAAARNP